MPFTELYTALESKALDGQEGPYTTILTSKINEVQQHLTARFERGASQLDEV